MKSLQEHLNESLRKSGWHHVDMSWSEYSDDYDMFTAYVSDMDCAELIGKYPTIIGKTVNKDLRVDFFDRKDNRIILKLWNGEADLFDAKKSIRSYKELTPDDITFVKKLGVNKTLGCSKQEQQEATEVICWVFNHIKL